MDVLLERFLYYEGEVRALGAIAVIVLPVVPMLFDGIVEHLLSFRHLLTNFWQIGKFERSTVLIYKLLNIQAVKEKVVVSYCEVLLGEVEGLLDEIGICIVHLILDGGKKSTK